MNIMNIINCELCDSIVFNHGKCVVHGKRGLVEVCYSFSLIEHGCDVLNKRSFACPYMLSEHILAVLMITAGHHG